MAQDETNYFASGLKAVIDRSFSSQKEFAEGTTSTVHLSNILRNNSGTSQPMRQQLASRAGMSVADIVNIGKDVLLGNHGSTRHTVQNAVATAPFDTNSLAEMGAAELMGSVSAYSSELMELMVSRVHAITSTTKTLAIERNRLLKLLLREQAILNSISETIKVVAKDFTLLYANRAHGEKFQQFAGDACSSGDCYKGECVANEVFATGKPTKMMKRYGNEWYAKVAYPVFSAAGNVDSVIIVTREISDFLDMLKEVGWTYTEPAEIDA